MECGSVNIHPVLHKSPWLYSSKHNSLALEEEEDTSLRKRYPDVEGHLYAVSLKKGKSGLGLSIVANNQAPRGIVVMGVQRGGVADLSGKVKWGDVILEVSER